MRHLASPDFPREWYVRQNELLLVSIRRSFDEARERQGFSLTWERYWGPVPEKLFASPYFMWVYLSGIGGWGDTTFEIPRDRERKKDRRTLEREWAESLLQRRDQRCMDITEEFRRNQAYVNSLNGRLF
jgi:hypothetical protein